MSLLNKINAELKKAMLSKDATRLRGLRSIKAALQIALTQKGSQGEMTTQQEIALLQKLVKQRKDAIALFEKENRKDLVGGEQEELDVIQTFLPKQISREEVEAVVKQIIKQERATSIKDMGKIMGLVGVQLAGQADKSLIAQVVKQTLISG